MIALGFVSLRRGGASLVVLSLAAAAVACGVRTPLTYGLDEGAATLKDAGTTVADASPTPRDAASVDSSDAESVDDAGPDVALPPTDLGNVLLTSGLYKQGTIETLSATAAFYPSVTATGCNVTGVAGCTLETCVTPDAGFPTLTNAGPIEVTGGLYPLVLVDTSGTYGPVSGDDAGSPDDASSPDDAGPPSPITLWHGGERLLVSGQGDTVPAFSAPIVAPTQLTILTPMPTLLARASPFAFSWVGASAGELTVDLSATAGGTSYYLECQFDVGAGTGAVPREALQTLPTGDVGLTVSTLNKEEQTAGAWFLAVFAQTNANDVSGAEYSGIVQIE